jgi:hypothetical protein
MIATRRLFAGENPVCSPGERVPRSSWLVAERPDEFVEVVPANLDRVDAVVCVAPVDVRSRRPDAPPWATDRIAWPGQWFRRSDQIVRDFPDRFKPLAGAAS